ncbi:hypothetical protein J6590_097810 [Homalodisca vitripennis]|nr:hypothetical protein J6590_097810 [Homalodisca vitripennis]
MNTNINLVTLRLGAHWRSILSETSCAVPPDKHHFDSRVKLKISWCATLWRSNTYNMSAEEVNVPFLSISTSSSTSSVDILLTPSRDGTLHKPLVDRPPNARLKQNTDHAHAPTLLFATAAPRVMRSLAVCRPIEMQVEVGVRQICGVKMTRDVCLRQNIPPVCAQPNQSHMTS